MKIFRHVTPDGCAVYSKFLLWIAARLSAIFSSVSWGQGMQAVGGWWSRCCVTLVLLRVESSLVISRVSNVPNTDASQTFHFHIIMLVFVLKHVPS